MNINKCEKGNVLIVVILLMAVMLAFIPVMTQITQQQSKDSMRLKNKTIARYLAEAGIERAIWELKETSANWDILLASGTLPGYNNNIYSDVNAGNGCYMIKISSTPDTNEVIVESTGKNKNGTEYYALQAVLKKPRLLAPVYCHNLGSSNGEISVFWGPIYDLGGMDLSNVSLNQYYPRKFCSTFIKASTGPYTMRDDNPNLPNTDNTEYWAYFKDMAPPPVPDFDYYRAEAAALGNYFSGNHTFSVDGYTDTDYTVRFVEGNATFKKADKLYKGIIIVMGDCTLMGNNDGGSGNYTITPHCNAYLEYQKNCPVRAGADISSVEGDTIYEDEYPGDGGLGASKSFTFGAANGGSCGKRISFDGFIYVGGSLTAGNTNPQVIYGALVMSEKSQYISGKIEVYYNPDISIKTGTQGIYLDSVKKTATAHF